MSKAVGRSPSDAEKNAPPLPAAAPVSQEAVRRDRKVMDGTKAAGNTPQSKGGRKKKPGR